MKNRRKCIICTAPFIAKRWQTKTCSKQCSKQNELNIKYMSYKGIPRPDSKICVVCGSSYKLCRGRTKTCSPKCQAIRHKETSAKFSAKNRTIINERNNIRKHGPLVYAPCCMCSTLFSKRKFDTRRKTCLSVACQKALKASQDILRNQIRKEPVLCRICGIPFFRDKRYTTCSESCRKQARRQNVQDSYFRHTERRQADARIRQRRDQAILRAAKLLLHGVKS